MIKISNKTSGSFAATVNKKEFRKELKRVMKDTEPNFVQQAFQDNKRCWLKSIEIIVEIDD